MQSTVEKTRAAVHTLIQSLDPALIALVGTSRDLEAIVDKQFDWQVRAHRWYAVISRGDHIHAVADIDDAIAVNAVWDRWVPRGTAPARICVEAKLAHHDFLLEVAVIAAR